MDVKRYFAPTAREALRALKSDLGAEAIVLANRAIAGGVEILAMPPGAIETLHSQPPREAPHDVVHGDRSTNGATALSRRASDRVPVPESGSGAADDFHVTLSQLAAGAVPRGLAERAPRREPMPKQPEIRPFLPPRINDPARADVGVGRAETPVSQRVVEKMAQRVAERTREIDRAQHLQETNQQLMQEISGIRGLIEREFASFSWGETQRSAPVRAGIIGHLLATGFSVAVARDLASHVSDRATPDVAQDTLVAALDKRVKLMTPEREIIDAGGIYALVGPTGVGKTTTVAKLAARFVARHGSGKLALITTDGYRIGAQEQLRIYGRILGVPVFAVRDAAELRQVLLEMRQKQLVLIDTMGMSQRDHMVTTQSELLAGAGDVKRLLLLNATSRGDTLDDVVGAFSGPDMAGCVLTKVDETASVAPAIDVVVRNRLEIDYVTDGQRVPEDLHLPDRARLLQWVLKKPEASSPWRFGHDDVSSLLAVEGASR